MLRREASTRIGLRTDCRCRELPIRRTLLMPGHPCTLLHPFEFSDRDLDMLRERMLKRVKRSR